MPSRPSVVLAVLLTVLPTLLLLVLFAPSMAQAHPEVGDGGLVDGLMHPVFGVDHLLAMVGVGVVSVQLGGANIWRLPLTFVGAMTIGGALGLWRVALPHTELGIDLSVAILGLGIFFAHRQAHGQTWVWPITGLVALFGTCHGYAHGLEVPNSASPLLYTLGFVIGTAALHILGMVLGEVATMRTWLRQGLRLAGAVVAMWGAAILVQTLTAPA
jgi:urease accessory protein